MKSTTTANVIGSRKRPRRGSANTRVLPNTAPDDKPPIICLTGFTREEKDAHQAWIERLGGIYTRNLDTDYNTCLVANEAEGPKYEVAMQADGTIQIVQPSWLEECYRQRQWIPIRPEDYHHKASPQKMEHGDDAQDEDDEDENDTSLAVTPAADLLLGQLEKTLAPSSPSGLVVDMEQVTLFLPCHFILVGFPTDANGREEEEEDSKKKEFQMLCRLIRCGLGRIAWTFNHMITHVVIPDDSCNDSVCDAAGLMQREHPNAPAVVSPRWILASWNEKDLLETTAFAPRYLSDIRHKDKKKPKLKRPSTKDNGIMAQNKKQPSLNSTNKIFRNYLFTLLRVAPPSWGIDYDTKNLEHMIQSNGGKLLTSQVVEALLVDDAAASMAPVSKIEDRHQQERQGQRNNRKKKKRAYVVCWGGKVDLNWAMHATLGQVKHLCDWTFVTPLWVTTCLAESKLLSMSAINQNSYPPMLFQPQPWPFRRMLDSVASSSKPKTDASIRIALTGFRAGSLQTAVIHFLRDMGAQYDESIVPDSTTHLIVWTQGVNLQKLSSSFEYERAVECTLYIVTLDWLFHVAQYGYHGKKKKKKITKTEEVTVGEVDCGCEADFPVDLSQP